MNELIINQCKLELAMGKVESVIWILLESTNKDEALQVDIILLSNRFQRLKARQLEGTIKDEEAEVQLVKIVKSLIEIIVF